MADPKARGAAIRSLEVRYLSLSRGSDTSPFVMMEDILEKLKLLDYEKHFCHMKNFKPLTRQFFALPQSNPAEQFYTFASLVSWLMAKNQHFFPAPGQFDDPNSTATNILQELKKMGFATDFAPAKLKAAHGEAVCGVLNNLLDQTLESEGFAFRKPIYPQEAAEEEAVMDEDGEADLAEIADEAAGRRPHDDDSEEEYINPVAASKAKDEREKAAVQGPIQTAIDPEKWRLELERVEPQLKIVLASDNKEWRTHVEQTRLHQGIVNQAMPETRSMLDRIGSDVHGALEKIQTREKYINNQLDGRIGDYRAVQERLNVLTSEFEALQQNVSGLAEQKTALDEALEKIRQDMDNRNGSMTDTAPVVKIKASLQKLKNESKLMEIRIGVVEQTLLQARLKNKMAAAVAPNPANASMEFARGAGLDQEDY